jgi:hypothetical protein
MFFTTTTALTPPGRSPASVAFPGASTPAYYNNAKYEEICCRAIKPIYDGSEGELMPFLTQIDIRRQDEGWAPTTYVTLNGRKLDLTYEFAHIMEADILHTVKARWTSSTVDDDKHTIGHDTCSTRLLAKCLMNSITTELSLLIINRISLAYQSDETYILWLISNNIHQNNVAFIEHIREKVMLAT